MYIFYVVLLSNQIQYLTQLMSNSFMLPRWLNKVWLWKEHATAKEGGWLQRVNTQKLSLLFL